LTTALVYSETVVHSAPERFLGDAPYQLAIVTFADGQRGTVRILGQRVAIDDAVVLVEAKDGVDYYRKQ
jgi:uncharacterized OB-fold protein